MARRGTQERAAPATVVVTIDKTEVIVEGDVGPVGKSDDGLSSNQNSLTSQLLANLSDTDDRLSNSDSGSAASSSSGDSSSGSEQGIKPNETELLEDTKKLREESSRLKLDLVEEKLGLIEKRLLDIEKGKDMEYNERIDEIQINQERKLNVARERYRFAADSIQKEYRAAISGIQEEIKNAMAEILLAQEAKHRITADQHGVHPMNERETAGHEFSFHIEHELDKKEIEEDLQRIRKASGSTPSDAPKSNARKYSLKEDILAGEVEASVPLDMEGEPFRLSKIRRKSR